MAAADYLRDTQVRQWLDGVEPAWTLLTFDSLRALRQEPSAVQTAIRIANDLSADEIGGSAVARNTLILLRQATERGGLPVTATGNLSRAVVAEMCKLFEWPDRFRNSSASTRVNSTHILSHETRFSYFCASPISKSVFAGLHKEVVASEEVHHNLLERSLKGSGEPLFKIGR
jgi:hypothetical protein